MEKLKIVYLPIAKIEEYANNPRIINDEAVEGVAESIKDYGFKVPVVVSTKQVGGGRKVCPYHRPYKSQSRPETRAC